MSGFKMNVPTNEELINGTEEVKATNYSANPARTKSTTSGIGYQMNSIFDNDTSEVSKQIIEVANGILGNKTITGQANPVSISGSDIFKGVNVTMVNSDGIKFSQAIVIDERPLKSVATLQDEAKTNGSVIFASALLNANNAKFLKEFQVYQKEAVVMEPLIVVAQTINGIEDIKELVKDVFKRMEAKPFKNVEASLTHDRSKPMMANTSNDGQNVKVLVTHKETAVTIEDLVVGSANTLLEIDARVEPSIGKKQRVVGNQNVEVHAVRPLVFIKDFNKPRTFAKFSLEYGLAAIVASTVLAKRDKTIMALMPSQKHKTNIGALNSIFEIHADNKGQYPEMPLGDPKAGLDVKASFIDELCTPAGLGLDIEYRATASAFTAFATLVDATASNEAKQSANTAIVNAIKNVTGSEYTGTVIERSFQYPMGLIIDKTGKSRDISTVDAIWLASNGETDLASRWIISDTRADSLAEKISILTELVNKHPDLDIKIKGAGIKIILAVEFIQALVHSAGIRVETTVDLEIPNQQSTFSMIGNLGITAGFDSAGYTYGGRSNGMNIII